MLRTGPVIACQNHSLVEEPVSTNPWLIKSSATIKMLSRTSNPMVDLCKLDLDYSKVKTMFELVPYHLGLGLGFLCMSFPSPFL